MRQSYSDMELEREKMKEKGARSIISIGRSLVREKLLTVESFSFNLAASSASWTASEYC